MVMDRLIADAAGIISIIGGGMGCVACIWGWVRHRARVTPPRSLPFFAAGIIFVVATLVVGGCLIIYPRLPHAPQGNNGPTRGAASLTATPASLPTLQSTTSPMALPTASRIVRAPTATPLLVLHVASTPANLACLDATHIGAATVTLTSIGSTVGVRYSVAITDLIPGTSAIWASAQPSGGIVPVGATTTITISPNAALCADGNLPSTGTLLHIRVESPAGTTVLAYTIFPYRKPL